MTTTGRRGAVLLPLLLAVAALAALSAPAVGEGAGAEAERVLFRRCQVCRAAVAHWQKTGAWQKGVPSALKEDDICPKVTHASPAFYRGKRCLTYEQGECQLYVDALPVSRAGGGGAGGDDRPAIVNPFLPGFVARRRLLQAEMDGAGGSARDDFDSTESREDEWCKETVALIKASAPAPLLMTQGCTVRKGPVPEHQKLCEPSAACMCLRDKDQENICPPLTPGQVMCVNAGPPSKANDPKEVQKVIDKRKAAVTETMAAIKKAGPKMEIVT